MERRSNVKPGDPTKIVRGLTTVFGGLHEMFEGITEQVEAANDALEAVTDGAETAREMTAKAMPVEVSPDKTEPEDKAEPEPKAPAKKGTRKTSGRKAKEPPAEEPPSEESTVPESAEVMPSEFEAVGDDAGEPVEEAAKTAKKPQTALTADDIRKVVVAKIKQKRDNSKAVQSLLEAYGVKALGDMEPEKYESFLSDISQL
ncbi:MAG: hypothetical protein LUE86_04810 [Clostridiales bacterium]|nr:hypothetical protein [Clostridiales bacterium]